MMKRKLLWVCATMVSACGTGKVEQAGVVVPQPPSTACPPCELELTPSPGVHDTLVFTSAGEAQPFWRTTPWTHHHAVHGATLELSSAAGGTVTRALVVDDVVSLSVEDVLVTHLPPDVISALLVLDVEHSVHGSQAWHVPIPVDVVP